MPPPQPDDNTANAVIPTRRRMPGRSSGRQDTIHLDSDDLGFSRLGPTGTRPRQCGHGAWRFTGLLPIYSRQEKNRRTTDERQRRIIVFLRPAPTHSPRMKGQPLKFGFIRILRACWQVPADQWIRVSLCWADSFWSACGDQKVRFQNRNRSLPSDRAVAVCRFVPWARGDT